MQKTKWQYSSIMQVFPQYLNVSDWLSQKIGLCLFVMHTSITGSVSHSCVTVFSLRASNVLISSLLSSENLKKRNYFLALTDNNELLTRI